MTDSSWEIHETAITVAECDREGQRSVYNMEHFSGLGGAKVGATMQEGDGFNLLTTIAEILRTDQHMATDQVVKKSERVGQAASHKAMRLAQVS